MRCLIILAFAFSIPFCLSGQAKQDHTWLLGTFGNPDDTTLPYGINVLDFSEGDLNIHREFTEVEFFLTNSSISNENGQLLFYSNGCKIFNSEFELMENGDGLNPGSAYSTGNCPEYGNTVPKGLLILPLPGDGTKYYVFHEATEQGEGVFSIHAAKLYYSLVDMSENNGLGKVIEKNEVVIADTLSGDMHAVRHANGEDWWVMVSGSHKDTYLRVLFTAEGIEGVQEQFIGMVPDPWYSGGTQAVFSPDGTRYARYLPGQALLLFGFDRESGELSDYLELSWADTLPPGQFGGLAFSPSGRFLYLNTSFELWQFDTWAADVQASRVHIASYDGYAYDGVFATLFGQVQLAPDCKLYMASHNAADVLHVVHRPDEPGLACDFRQHDFKLPAVNGANSIPNFPNYRLGTGLPVCDSTIQLVTGTVRARPPVQEVQVWPNPARGQVQVGLPVPLASRGEWRLYDGLGRLAFSGELAAGQTEHVFELEGLPPGLYFWEMESAGERAGSGKLILME